MEDLNFQMNLGEGVQKVNAEGHNLSYFYKKPKQKEKNPKLRNFRLGEIVQGKILSLIDEGIGLVRLPNGDFSCHLHKGLLQGDDIFFKIDEVEPNLVLKVHSVQSHIKGIKRKKEDIVRILDLPYSELYLYTSDLFLTFKNMIYKDDLLKFFKFYTKVPRNEKYKTDSFARALFWMAEYSLPFEYDLFLIAYNYYEELKYLDELQYDFFNSYENKIPNSLNHIISIFKDNFYGDLKDSNLKFNFYSLNSENIDFCFYKLLSKISASSISELMNNIPIRLQKFIESMHLWNQICTSGNSPYHWTFPFTINNKTRLYTFVFRSQFNIYKLKNDDSIKYHEIDIGITLCDIIKFLGNDFIKEASAIQNVEHFASILSKYLSQAGLLLLSIHYSENNHIKTIESPTGATISANKSISFVI